MNYSLAMFRVGRIVTIVICPDAVFDIDFLQ